MKDRYEMILRERYSIPRQPYSIHLRNIGRMIETRRDDTDCVEMLKAYLSLAGVPVEDHSA